VPSFLFFFAVNPVTESTINKLQALALRKIKKWLNLPRSFTASALYHPGVIDIPELSALKTKAKLTLLASISTSQDPLIEEISGYFTNKSFCEALKVPSISCDILQKAKSSIASITTRSLNKECKRIHRSGICSRHEEHLKSLSVQSKFLEVTDLESQNRVWNRVMLGLPAGQYSFILRAGTDTLPTPLNLKRWKYKADARCTLCCNTNPTVHHILSNCPVSLNQGRYTWRHDCALAAIQKGIQTHLPPEVSLIVDLPGSRACENPVSTIPDRILVTSARPDIVLITESEKKIDLLELTIPHNSLESISNARTRKSTKENYQQALSDLESRDWSANLHTIEIGSLGHWVHSSLRSLCLACPSISKKDARAILDSAATKVISASELIFRARQEAEWTSSRPLL